MKKIYFAILMLVLSVSSSLSIAAELETKFLSYEITGQLSSTINAEAATVSVLMPAGTDLSELVTKFTLSVGAKAYIGTAVQVSGTTVDFTDTVEYNVVNGTTATQKWTVTAIAAVKVTFNVDMTNAELVEGDVVYVTGSFNGWNEPGTGASVLLADEDADGIYSGMVYVAENAGEIKYKYFKNASWSNGDPYNGGTDRALQIGVADVNIAPVDVWNEPIVKIAFKVNMAKAELIEGDVVYVTGSFVGWNEPGNGKSVLMTDADADGIWTATVPVTKNAGNIEYKYFKNATFDNGDPIPGGNRKLTVADANITIDPIDVWGGGVSVSQEEFELVSTYPNPFKNQLTITNLDGVNEIVVSSLIGQILTVKSVNSNEITINTTEFESGMYLVIVRNNAGNSKAMRIIKQ